MDKYNKLFKEFKENKEDIEFAHIIQDSIYRKFINDVSNNKFQSIDEMRSVANKIKKLIVIKNKWYA